MSPLEALHNTIVFDPRDWSSGKGNAWIYGIVVGWGEFLPEICKRYHWDDEVMEMLKQRHNDFIKLKAMTLCHNYYNYGGGI